MPWEMTGKTNNVRKRNGWQMSAYVYITSQHSVHPVWEWLCIYNQSTLGAPRMGMVMYIQPVNTQCIQYGNGQPVNTQCIQNGNGYVHVQPASTQCTQNGNGYVYTTSQHSVHPVWEWTTGQHSAYPVWEWTTSQHLVWEWTTSQHSVHPVWEWTTGQHSVHPIFEWLYACHHSVSSIGVIMSK